MKTKLTLLIVETQGFVSRNIIPKIAFLTNSKGEFINKYISSKTTEETLRDLTHENCNLDFNVLNTRICDCIHEMGSNETEVIYYSLVSKGILRARNNCEITSIDKILIKDKYVRSIQEIPRC
jgi:hypothetical protein